MARPDGPEGKMTDEQYLAIAALVFCMLWLWAERQRDMARRELHKAKWELGMWRERAENREGIQ